jgi:acetyl-CoA acetyltransferase
MIEAGRYAIAGLGLTPQGRVYDRSYLGFAVDAVRAALDDAGMDKGELDGLLVNPGISWRNALMASVSLQNALGLHDLRYTAALSLGGATAAAMVQSAAAAIDAGLAESVACVFSDAPLKKPKRAEHGGERPSSGASYAMARGWDAAFGFFGVNPQYAMLARRHMHLYGTTQDQLGMVAVNQRAWAQGNDDAEMQGRGLDLAEYNASRWVVEPFHLFDCCLVSNGGACVIVTSRERAARAAVRPVEILGFAQAHPGTDPLETMQSGAVEAGNRAFAMAGITRNDVDVAELYDCYTFTVLITLEDYGFCAKGESGAFVEAGETAPGGSLPVNTGGGQLSSFYMWGMTPIVEAVIQLRGAGGARQVDDAQVALVSGNGGILATHSTLLLGRG